MAKQYRILVGIDFEATGDEALRMGVELAQAMPSAELHLTTVVVERRGSPSAERLAEDERLLDGASKRLREYLDGWRARWTGEQFERPMSLHVRLGDAADALHQVAVDVEADLIVVGTHGTRGLARLVLGSVSERLVKLARVPVLVARPKDYSGMSKSVTRPEAPRPGQTDADLHAAPSYELRGTLSLGGRGSHVSGAI